MEMQFRARMPDGGPATVNADLKYEGTGCAVVHLDFEYSEHGLTSSDPMIHRIFSASIALEDIATLGAVASSILERRK